MIDKIKNKQKIIQFQEFLSRISSIDKFEISDMEIPTKEWSCFSSYYSKPFNKIDIDEDKINVEKWLSECLEKFQNLKYIFISIGGFGDIPWTKLTLNTDVVVLVTELWFQSEIHDFLLMEVDDTDDLIGFIEDEYCFEFHKYIDSNNI